MRTTHFDGALLAKIPENRSVTPSRISVRHVANRYAAIACLTSLILLAGLFSSRPLNGQESHPLSLAAHIPLPNVKGRIDHFSIDVKGGRLFVAAVENHSLEVLDLKTRHDPRSKAVIVGYAGAKQLRKRKEGTGGLGFIDENGKKLGDIVTDAHPESFQLEKNGSRIFVNVPDKKEIEVIDGIKRSVLARWPVSEEDNFPMGLDEADRRLFIGVWKPAQLLVFDTESGKQVATGDIAGKTDDLFYDPASRRVYVLTAKGFLEVFKQKDADHYNRVARYPTPPGSQTGLLVPEWGKLFVAVPPRGNRRPKYVCM